jgi:predicted metal-binding membrane protein
MTSALRTARTVAPGATTMPLRPDRLTGVVLTLAALAWAGMAVGQQRGDHGHTVGWAAALTGWLIMIVAMMLPTALPLLGVVRRLVSGHRHRALIVLLAAATFVAVWLLAGVLLVSGTVLAASLATRVRLPHEHMLLGGALLLAGLYQFTAWKDRCLTACRTPRGVAMTRWRGRRPAWVEAATVAAVYAGSCVGCCWALMATGLVTSAGALAAMAVLTFLMAAERLTRHGRVLVRPVGAAAIILGVSLLLGVDALVTT